jgi:fatty acid desaturase
LAIGVVADRGFFILLWLVQFLIGCWQLLSAVLTTLDIGHGNRERTRMIRIYWMAVAIYFVVLAAVFFMLPEIVGITWFFTAWLIAVYYYVFTIKLIFGKSQVRETFLDVAN